MSCPLLSLCHGWYVSNVFYFFCPISLRRTGWCRGRLAVGYVFYDAIFSLRWPIALSPCLVFDHWCFSLFGKHWLRSIFLWRDVFFWVFLLGILVLRFFSLRTPVVFFVFFLFLFLIDVALLLVTWYLPRRWRVKIRLALSATMIFGVLAPCIVRNPFPYLSIYIGTRDFKVAVLLKGGSLRPQKDL